MIDPSRHVPLHAMPWSASEAVAAIEEIVADAARHFDAGRFWPSHPREDGVPDGMANLYFAVAGVIWGLDHLARSGTTRLGRDFRPVVPRLLEAGTEEFSADTSGWRSISGTASRPADPRFPTIDVI